MIPKQLNNLKFCRIKKRSKAPFEKDWVNKHYSYEEITPFLQMENYGILCGYENLAVIDCDNDALRIAIETILPKTFSVKTGSGGTHFYYFIPNLKKKIILEAGEIHLGEVQSHGTQVVGAGSIHPNGAAYEIKDNEEIKEIPIEELYSVIRPFMKEIKEAEENSLWERKENSEIDELSVVDIWGISGMKKSGNEYYGEHPVHGSDGGMNFWINPLKNTWHCFRCDSGGGALSAIAVKEGIINCSDAQRGYLRGEKALECINLAREKYGLKKIEKIDEILKKENELKIIWDNELENYEEEEKEWIIDKLIPNRSVCILTGKRGTLKTFLALQMAYSICSGNEFLNKFQTKQGGVLYLDKENGIYIMKKRTKMIKEGLNLQTGSLEVGFICFSTIKIDKISDINKLEEAIKEYHPKILIIDTYRRAISFDENDAGSVSELFVDILRPLVEKYNISILLIHHNRKSGQGSGDEMDEIRGSSDLANYSDIILKTERKGEELILKQLKNRNAKEEEPIKIKLEFSEQFMKMNYEGAFEKQNQTQRCAESLIIWIMKDNITNFKTKEAKEIAFKEGIKETNFKYSLQELESRGIIKKIRHGEYETKNYKI